MTVFRNEGGWDTSNVEFRDGEIIAYSKTARTPAMHHIDYGLSVFRAEVFRDVPLDSPTDLAALFEALARRRQLAAYEIHQRFYEVGSFSGLAELEAHFAGSIRMTYAEQHLTETIEVVRQLDPALIERMVQELVALRERGGRLFFLGVGGSAGNCSHAVNDFRKIVGIEAYAPTDNVSELTARTNDEGWPTIFGEWLAISRLNAHDAVLVFSVGGGNLEKNVSPNLVAALQLAKEVGARIIGIVGRDGGYTAKVGDACVIVPTVNPDNVTPHSEAFQAVVWHLLVSHPALKAQADQVGIDGKMTRRAVFLDRDGVLNRAIVRDGKPYPPAAPAELEILPGVPEALARLRSAGFRLVVVTNQPDVGRGTMPIETVEAIHARMAAALPLDAIEVCPHGGHECCDCRKPKAGHAAARRCRATAST